MLFLPFLGLFEFILVAGFPFFIDLDMFFAKYAKDQNHRRLITHSLLPYIVLLVIGIFFPVVLALGICGMVHILTDVMDWGSSLFSPFYREPIGGLLPKPPKEIIEIPDIRKRQCWFTITYYKFRILGALEVFLGIAAIVTIILIDIWYLWATVSYFFFTIIQIRFYFGCPKSSNNEKEA